MDEKIVDVTRSNRAFFQKVYLWMCFGLLLSALVAFLIARVPLLMVFFLGNSWLFILLIILELILVFSLVRLVKHLSPGTAVLMFVVYAFLNGITLSVIFLVYAISSIFAVFLVTAGMFGIMALIGLVTKKNLSSWGMVLYLALIGIILAALVNVFLGNSVLDLIISIIGVIIFAGLTAFDMQKIKQYSYGMDENSADGRKAAILGALTLYLDFINLFLSLLRIFGRRD